MLECYDVEIEKDLVRVEEMLTEALSMGHTLLKERVRYFGESKGKRLRPLMVLHSGRLGEYQQSKLLPLAVAVEVLHMASLVHDDIIDDALVRRGRASVHARWGKGMGLLVGDFYFAKSMDLLCRSLPTATREIIRAAAVMVEGEMEAQQDIYNLDVDEERYLARIRKKTAALMGACCKAGGYAAGLRGRKLKALELFGEYFGMAFQIRDDYLDYSEREEAIGKPVGNDFYQGVVTVPLIHYIRERKMTDEEKQSLRRVMLREEDTFKLRNLCQDMKESGSLQYTARLAEGYASKAIKQLDWVSPGSSGDSLKNLIGAYFIKEK